MALIFAMDERVGHLPLQTPPVPRCSRQQNHEELRVLKLIRGGEWKAALESLGNGSDSESTWRRWRVLTGERRQLQASYISSRNWCSIQRDKENTDLETLRSRPPANEELSGRLLNEISDLEQSARQELSEPRKVKRKERFAYPHIAEEKQRSGKIAEHVHEWADLKIRSASRRDFRLLSPNEEDRSRSKSSFSSLPAVAKDGLLGPKLLVKPAAHLVMLPYFDTLGIKVLNSPEYPNIKNCLAKCKSESVELENSTSRATSWEHPPAKRDENTLQILDSSRRDSDFLPTSLGGDEIKRRGKSSVSKAIEEASLDAKEWMDSLVRNGAAKVIQARGRGMIERARLRKAKSVSKSSEQSITPHQASQSQAIAATPADSNSMVLSRQSDAPYFSSRFAEIEIAYQFWTSTWPEAAELQSRSEMCNKRSLRVQKWLRQSATDIARFKKKDRHWIAASVRNDEIGQQLKREADETRDVYKRIADLQTLAAEMVLKRAKRESQDADLLNAEAKAASEVAERVSSEAEALEKTARRSAETAKQLREQVKPAANELTLLQDKYRKAERESEKARRDLSKAEAAVLAAQFHATMPAKGHHHNATVLKKTYEESVESARSIGEELQALQSSVAEKEAQASTAELKAKNDLLYANDMKKSSEVERRHAEELLLRVARAADDLQRTEQNLFLRVIAVHAAKDELKRREKSATQLLVLDRLRAKSLGSSAESRMIDSHGMAQDLVLKDPVYIGERKDGKRHGFGVLEFEQGVEYCGHWKEDVPDGAGVERFSDGSFYAGFFQAGLRHGLGAFMLSGGLAFLGAWAAGQRVGHGLVAMAAPQESDQHAFYPLALISFAEGRLSEVKDFKAGLHEHCMLMSDVQLAAREAWAVAGKARSEGFRHYFGTCEKQQEQRVVNMGLTLLTEKKSPMVVAFQVRWPHPDLRRRRATLTRSGWQGMDSHVKARMKFLNKARA